MLLIGWFSSPVNAHIYRVCKYTAHFSDKGYAVGADFWGWLEAEGGQVEGVEVEVKAGDATELWAIKGSRNGSFFFNSSVVWRSPYSCFFG